MKTENKLFLINSILQRIIKPLIFAACIFLFSYGTLPARRNPCKKLKNGKFILRSAKANGMIFYIERTDSIQLESDNKTDYHSKMSVKWTSDCSYELLLLETTFPFSDSIQNIRKTIPLEVEIIKSTNKFYVFNAQRKNNKQITDTLWFSK